MGHMVVVHLNLGGEVQNHKTQTIKKKKTKQKKTRLDGWRRKQNPQHINTQKVKIKVNMMLDAAEGKKTNCN